ncbi:MAG: 3-hydroxylacyl-ACP dehydratase, partial [Pseudomonadota bacterium]
NLLSATDTPPAIGYLASVRDLKLDIEDLGTVAEDLRVTARRLSGDASGFIYEFEIRAGARAVLSGRLAAKLLAAGAVA